MIAGRIIDKLKSLSFLNTIKFWILLVCSILIFQKGQDHDYCIIVDQTINMRIFSSAMIAIFISYFRLQFILIDT